MAICGNASVSTGPILLSKRAVAPAADRQQLPGQAEDELDHRRDDEGRDGDAGRRHGNHRVVAELVLVERGDDAEHAAEQQRQDQRRGAELDRNRQALGEQFGDGEIGQVVARPEIAVQKIVEIVDILQPERIVEAELGFDVGLDLGAQPPLLVEWAARRHADQEKRQRDDDEQRRDGGQKPPEDVSQHRCPA